MTHSPKGCENMADRLGVSKPPESLNERREKMTLLTLDPTGVKQVQVHSLAPRLKSFNGARVGVLHNVKHNAKELLVAIADLLQERYTLAEVVGPVLTDQSMLASSKQLDEMAAKCDVVLTGLGD